MLGRAMGSSSGVTEAASRAEMTASAGSGQGCLRRQELRIQVCINLSMPGNQHYLRGPSRREINATTPAKQLKLCVFVSLHGPPVGIALETLAFVHLPVFQYSFCSCRLLRLEGCR